MIRAGHLCIAFGVLTCACGGGEGSMPQGMDGAASPAAVSSDMGQAASAAGPTEADSTAERDSDGSSTAGSPNTSSADPAQSAAASGSAASTGPTAGGGAQAGAGAMEPNMDAAAAGSAGAAVATTSGVKLKPVTSVAEEGPYATTVDAEADDGAGYLVYPTELGAEGLKHPIFVWGTGSGSVPMQYNMHLTRLASHGFVVYSADTSSVTGELLTRGIDFLFAENDRQDSPFYQKLDLTKLGVGGHSLGSLSTYDIADDPRITTTVHVDGGQFDGMGGPRLHKPAIFICGEDSWGTPNCNDDYEGASIPIFYTRIAGLIGAEGHIMAADAGLEIWLAWMRWQLGGEEERRADFLDPMGVFSMGKYDSQSKNW